MDSRPGSVPDVVGAPAAAAAAATDAGWRGNAVCVVAATVGVAVVGTVILAGEPGETDAGCTTRVTAEAAAGGAGKRTSATGSITAKYWVPAIDSWARGRGFGAVVDEGLATMDDAERLLRGREPLEEEAAEAAPDERRRATTLGSSLGLLAPDSPDDPSSSGSGS
jgi:hypothetical protein